MSELHKIFSTDEHCLTEDQLLHYLQNKLSPTDQRIVETHLLNCELCSDALEGFALTKSPEKLPGVLSEVHQMIDNRVAEKEIKIIKMPPWHRIAATITLVAICGGALIYLQNGSKKLEKVVAEQKLKTPVSNPNNFELKPTEPISSNQPQSTTIEKRKTPTLTIKNNKADQPVTENSKTEDIDSYNLAAAESRESDELTEVSAKSTSPQQAPVKEPEVRNKESITTTKDQIKNISIDKNTSTPASLNKKSKQENFVQQSNSAFIIDNGKLQMQNEQYDSANYLFDQVINNNDTKYIEEALWNKAISLEKLKRIDDANVILNQISNMNGNYKEKAKKKLKQNAKPK